jgi:hypothetical protein
MELTTTCKNCSRIFSGKFCPSCGQSSSEERLDWVYLKQFLKKLFFNFLDKGLIYSCKQLIIRPGHTIREYIEGKRIYHMNPFTLLISLAGLYGFIYHTNHINTFNELTNPDPLFEHIDFNKVNEWISTHFAYSIGLLIPFYALGTKIAFIGKPYNYIEFFVLNTFIGAFRMLVHFVILPFLIYFKKSFFAIGVILDITTVLDIILFIFIITQFFEYKNLLKTVICAALAYLLFVVFYMLMILGIVWGYNFIYY